MSVKAARASVEKLSSRAVQAAPSSAEEDQLGLSQMRRMSPFNDEREILLPAALLCHVMLLNSVLERSANRFAEEHGLTFP